MIFDRREWRTVFLERVDADDIPVMAALLRPLGWLGERGVGDWVALDLPETGYTGRYRITAIGSCPEIEVGPGRVVTGLFRRGRSEVFNLWVAGEPRPLGGTAKHPVWSVDRGDWVPVGDLRPGERLKTLSGTAAVERVESAGEEPVYTLEVEGDHCYRVGEQGILVHNASVLPSPTKDGITSVLTELGCCATTQLIDLSQDWRNTKFDSDDLAVIYILRDDATNEILKTGKTTTKKSAFVGRWDDYEKAERLTNRELVLDVWVFAASCVTTVEEAEKKGSFLACK